MCAVAPRTTISPVARIALATLFMAAVLGCGIAEAEPQSTAQPQLSARSDAVQQPTASPAFEPASASAGGTVIRVEAGGVVIRNVEEELNVDLLDVRSIWKETEVTPADLEIGDELFLNGTRSGSTFHARYVWANIGRFDGILQAGVGQRLEMVRLPPKSGRFEVELSRFVEIIWIDGTAATVADLVAGTNVGGVTYRPKNAIPRATKIWLSRP
jgi:hypothetical protein